MFGLSFSGQLIQGSAERTWNCISQLANLVWYKINNYRQPIMPRSRRKHHSRSRSHSHDKERDAKRRKIEQYDSPNHKRSVSPSNDPTQEHPESTSNKEDLPDSTDVIILSEDEESTITPKVEQNENNVSTTSNEGAAVDSNDLIVLSDSDCEDSMKASEEKQVEDICNAKSTDMDVSDVATTSTNDDSVTSSNDSVLKSDKKIQPESKNIENEINITPRSKTVAADSKTNSVASSSNDDSQTTATPVSNSVKKLFGDKTPTRRLTPKQLERRLESEKKKQQREKEKEEREKQRQLEKQKKTEQKQKEMEQKQKEIERKQKEKEEKEEQKRQEKELKLKQKEEEKMRKQQEIDEKNKEKLREEEKKQKAAAAFVSFFVPKKGGDTDEKKTEETTLAFLPFEVKCDMKLPPPRREPLTCEQKTNLVNLVTNNVSNFSYLDDLRSSNTKTRSCGRTWTTKDTDGDDVIILDDEVLLGETICELKPKTERMKVKLLQFHENQRPAYYGTWRKKSKNITGRKPWSKEEIFDYEVDSDDDWEEEEQGENLEVVSDDEKENEPENEDYEVDNEFFVPHGHLSDDEVDDEENCKLSPESQKQKLKLLKDAFDLDIKSKMQKIKPRSIGCIWYNKDGNNVDEAIDRYLHPLNIIINAVINIKKRGIGGTGVVTEGSTKKKRKPKPLPDNIMRVLAKMLQGSVKKREKLVDEFLEYIKVNNFGIELTKTNISRQISHIAEWTKTDEKTNCWMVNKHILEKYNVDLAECDKQDTVQTSANTDV